MELTAARADEVRPFVDLLEHAARWLTGQGVAQWAPGTLAAQTERFARAQQRGDLLIVRGGNTLLGGVCLSDEPDPIWLDAPRVRTGYLSKLVIDRTRAGRRFGEAIIEGAEAVGRERGYEWLRLDCVASNARMIRYYQALGYYPRGSVPSRDGVDLARHEKRLVGFDFSHWNPQQHATLLFLTRNDEVLLIHKKRGHGAGKINAPGGMIEPGESPVEAAVRETREEVGINVHDPVAVAELRFQDSNGSSMRGWVYTAARFSGDPVETAEARPFWCNVHTLPFDRMWDDDVLWLPRVLEGRRLIGEFLMENDRLAAHRLRYVGQLPF